MAYCMKCGKEIPDGDYFCDEHSVTSVNSELLMPNVSFVGANAEDKPDFNVSKNGAVTAQFQSQNYQQPAVKPKLPPLWLFPVFSLAGVIVTSLLNLLITGVIGQFLYSDGSMYLTSSINKVLSVAITFVLNGAAVIVYNKMCKKSQLTQAVFPIYYLSLAYVGSIAGNLVANILNMLVNIVVMIIENFASVSYYTYSTISIVTSYIGVALGIAGVFFVYFFVYKYRIKKNIT